MRSCGREIISQSTFKINDKLSLAKSNSTLMRCTKTLVAHVVITNTGIKRLMRIGKGFSYRVGCFDRFKSAIQTQTTAAFAFSLILFNLLFVLNILYKEARKQTKITENNWIVVQFSGTMMIGLNWKEMKSTWFDTIEVIAYSCGSSSSSVFCFLFSSFSSF